MVSLKSEREMQHTEHLLTSLKEDPCFKLILTYLCIVSIVINFNLLNDSLSHNYDTVLTLIL